MRIVAPIPKNPASKAKFVKNIFFCLANFTHFMSKSIQILDHFFPLVFPQDSFISFSPRNLKSLDIGLWEVGAKICLNGVNKGEKIPKQLFAPRRFQTIFEQKSLHLRPLLSITFSQEFPIFKNFGHWGKKMFKRYLKIEQIIKNPYKNFFRRGDFRPFLSKNVQI